MEHDYLGLSQRIRYELDLPTLAKNHAPEAFEDMRKEKEPFRSFWETTALSDTATDRFAKALTSKVDRQIEEGISAGEMASGVRKFVYTSAPMKNREAVQTIMQELEWLRKKEVERMLYGSVSIRVIESEHITKEVQVRRHRKKRIDKKWRKRYGMKRVPDMNTMVLSREASGEQVLLAHPRTIQKIREHLGAMDGVEILSAMDRYGRGGCEVHRNL